MSLTPPGGLGRPLPVRASDLLLLLIASLGAVRLAAAVVAGAVRPGAAADGDGDRVLIMTLGLLLFQTAVMLGAIHALVIRKYALSWADLGLRPAARRWYGRAVVIAILLLPAVALVNALILKFADQPFENPQIYAIAPAGFSWFAVLAMTVMAGIVAPFAEEVAFRGLLFPWLRERLGVPGAAVASGVCFAALHGVILLIPALTVIGIALALVYQRSGSLWPAVVTHGVFNIVMITALYAALAGEIELP
ncbi:MAG: lysostaphin resistance A-like protein [Kiloniellaceae bacterium]